ncbi:MAG: regulator [Bacteroidetes bacterium CG12_big_fil_rev_8_21_14_0_65_60_17]|nr:MAG: regulator [Bacteroidetes bacterium CG12_big_fil_rev_8_21_14_0_65_60_17]
MAPSFGNRSEPPSGSRVCAALHTNKIMLTVPERTVTHLAVTAALVVIQVAFFASTTFRTAAAQVRTSPAGFTEWTAHTSFRTARAIAAGSNTVWAASDGGVFGYDLGSGEITRLTIVEGLSSVQGQSIAVDDARREVWVGYADGVLDRIDVDTGDVRAFRDIARADQFPSRGINRIVAARGVLYIATSFGIVVFSPDRGEVEDSFTRLGPVPPAIAVSDVLIAPGPSGEERLWAAVSEGVVSVPLSAPNLQDPSAWSLHRTGLSGNALEVQSLAFSGGSVYAGTGRDVFRWLPQSNRWEPLNVTSEPVPQLAAKDGGLVGIDRFRLLTVDAQGSARQVAVPGFIFPSGVAVTGDGDVWMTDSGTGLIQIGSIPTAVTEVTPQQVVVPDGPSSGAFSTLETGPDGTLWAGGADASNTGFHMRRPDGSWADFTNNEFPELSGRNRFLSVHVDGDGTAWFGSQGGGVARVENGEDLTLYDATNSSLRPATGTGNFVVVSGVDGDRDGSIWATTRASGFPLHRRSPDGSWTEFTPVVGQSLTANSNAYGPIYIDSFGQKWIIVLNETNFRLVRGLMVLDTGNPDAAQDDEFRFFGSQGGSGLGLPSTTVTAVTEDRDGLVWIGTSSGPAFFINTGIVARDQSSQAIWPQWADRSLGTFVLFGLEINDIAVDPANRVWFATNEGAWLIEPVEGGFAPVIQLTVGNSPLFSNVILSIAIDASSGEVYFATDRGALSLTSDAVAAAASSQDLTVFPNPVRLDSDQPTDIFIDGLVESTDIRIMTLTGSLVRRLDGRGGRIRWDGRDETGRLVDSGMYLVVAVGTNDEGTAYGKVAIIH